MTNRFFKKSYDGGPNSGVTGYWLVEDKSRFSIVLLHFKPGTRDAFHSHAFNALSIWLWGKVTEEYPDSEAVKVFYPGSVKYTPKHLMHRIRAGNRGAWCLSFRGPWDQTWKELVKAVDGSWINRVLSIGRKEVMASELR